MRSLGRIQFPMKRVHIELTNICNFNCIFCPKFKMTRKNGYMDLELAKKIIDELKKEKITEKITFHIMGEPFLHPQFFEIIQHAVTSGMKVGITTNGSYLSEENAKKLSEVSIDQINISLQTPSEDTFLMRQSHTKHTYAEYCKNILLAINQFFQNNNKTTIKLHFLNTRYNKSIKDTVGDVSVISSTKELREVLSAWVKNIYSLASAQNKGNEKKALSNIAKLSIHKWHVLEVYPQVFLETYVLDTWGDGLRKNTLKKSKFGYCSALADHFGILWNGDFILCCKDFDGKTKMSNVKESSIMDILNRQDIKEIYNGFKRYKVIHPQCQICLGGPSATKAFLKQAGSILFFDLLKPIFYNQKRLY